MSAESQHSPDWQGLGHLEIERDGDVLRVRLLTRSLGSDESPAIHHRVSEEIAAVGPALKGLVLDVSGVAFMNSMGVGTCIELRNRAVAAGAKAVLLGLSGDLEKLMQTVKVDTLFALAANEGEVRAALRR